MRIVFTDQSLERLEESLKFMQDKLGIPINKILEINEGIFAIVEPLSVNPYLGQLEEKLEHLPYSYRRLIFKHFKIIYRVGDSCVYITDIFDSRQSPDKMKG